MVSTIEVISILSSSEDEKEATDEFNSSASEASDDSSYTPLYNESKPDSKLKPFSKPHSKPKPTKSDSSKPKSKPDSSKPKLKTIHS